jgi:hypothetical protein
MIITAGLPSGSKVNRLAFNSDNHIYAATQSEGFFYSADAGNNWISKNDGLPTINGFYPAFNFLYVDSDDLIFAGTHYQGLFVGGNPATSVNTPGYIPAEFSLQQNYPNPFNPSTTIPFSFERAGYVELTVFNTLGQKVKTLFSGQAPPGNHAVHWEGKDEEGYFVASGVYIYQLKQENRTLVGKMILMR